VKMDIIQITKKSADLTWRYRSLWLFGFLLAMTVTTTIWFGWPNRDGRYEEFTVQNRIILPNKMVLRFPGEGVTIDLENPDGHVIKIEGLPKDWWYQTVSDKVNLSDLWALLITIGIVVVIYILLSILFRCTSEAALIRMVDENERNHAFVSTRQGFRLGWSRVAWKFFLIDFFIGVIVFLILGLLLTLAISPFFLFGIESFSKSVPAVITISVISLAGLVLFILAAIVIGVSLSITKPVMRRGCAVDGLGVWASIRQGFRLLRTQFDKVALTWLVSIGVRLVWTLAIIPVFILLIPVMILTIMLGVLVAGIPSLVATWIASLFVGPIFAWVIGLVVGIPLFLILAFSPVIFLSGWVETFRSSLWTLSFREFHSQADASSLQSA